MTLDFKIVSTIVGIFAGLGIMIGGCGYVYSSWKNGKNKYKDELIADLKATLEIKERDIGCLNAEKTTLIKSHQEQFTKLTSDFAELKGRFNEQSKKLEEYREIFQNRDSQSLQMLKEIKEGIVVLNKHHVESQKALITAAEKVAKTKE